MQRRAAAMYVAFFLAIAVGTLGFVTIVDGPSPAMEDPDYQLQLEDTVTIDGVEYQLTMLDEFSASLTYTVEDAEIGSTLGDGDTVNMTGTDYRVEIPDVDEPANFTLVETWPEHDLPTTEDDEGNTLVYIEEDDVWVDEEEYLEDEYGPREEIVLTEGDTFEFIPEDADEPVEATVGQITPAGVEVTWVGAEEQRVPLTRDDVNTIGGSEFGANWVGLEYIQLSSDLEAFEEHRTAQDTWAERHQGMWGIGVLSIIAAVLIGGLSYLPRRR